MTNTNSPKEVFDNFVKQMNEAYNEQTYLIDLYNNSVNPDTPELEYFDCNKAIKFTRTWELIQQLKPQQRNLLICRMAFTTIAECLRVFNGVNNTKTNDTTFRVLVYNAKNELKRLYNQRYDNL